MKHLILAEARECELQQPLALIGTQSISIETAAMMHWHIMRAYVQYTIQGRAVSSHVLHSADASECHALLFLFYLTYRHACSAHVIRGLHQACLEPATVALCHTVHCIFPRVSFASHAQHAQRLQDALHDARMNINE